MAITNIKNMDRNDGVGNTPYFDDFNETKNFYRILYKPGFAVQARELNQMQTLINAQIDRAGQYAFKDGSRVVKGEVTLNNEFDYIQLEDTHTNNLAGGGSVTTGDFISDFVGKTIEGSSNTGNQIRAKVLKVVTKNTSNSAPHTLYIKYKQKGGPTNNRTVEKFVPGEEIKTTTGTVRFSKVLTTGATINFDQGDSTAGFGGGPVGSLQTKPVGVGSIAHIDEGVYFIKGNYIYVPKSELLLDPYQLASDPSQADFTFSATKNKPTYLVGLKTTETTVTSSSDSSLLDNASGTSNASAPGADRYKIEAVLAKDHIRKNKRANNEFINILRVVKGIVRNDNTDKTDDTQLTKRLATRTFEESGDYSVRPFQLDLKEHLNNEQGNNGFKKASAGGDDGKIAIGVEPNVTYIKGFRNENLTTTFIEADKPRGATDKATEADTFTQLNTGNFIKLTTSTIKGVPPLGSATEDIDLHSVLIAGTQASGNKIGTAKVKEIAVGAGATTELYLYNIVMDSGENFSSVKSVRFADSSAVNDFVGDLATAGKRFRNKQQGGVWKLPYNAVNDLSNMSYRVRVLTSAITAADGKFTVPSSSGNVDEGDLILAVGANTTLTGSNVTKHSSTSASSLILDANAMGFANGTVAKVIYTKAVTSNPRTKTFNTGSTVTINVTDGTAQSYGLGKTDVIKINSITDSAGDNVTDRFTLDDGQRQNIYLVSKIIKKAGSAPVATGNMVVNFDNYTHGATGDYFSAESYGIGNVSSAEEIANYKRIPQFNSNRDGLLELRDCLDFRAVQNDNGVGFKNMGLQPKEGSNFEVDLGYYLPRIDKLIQEINGNFKVISGVSSESPVAPEDPEDSIIIGTIDLPAFTFDAKNVRVKLKDNKRYTMRDIGNIDKRVKNLEYYTSLSLLEKSAQDTQIFDGNDERFKNGFLVDGFYGHNVGDVTNPDYNVAIDRKNGILRPKCATKNVALIRAANENNSTANACDKNASIVTMNVIDEKVEFASQPYATTHINVNPYDVFTWGGQIKLSPESDEWKEVDVRPDIIIDDSEAYDQFVKMAEEQGILGTVWNEWETNWTGVEIDQWTDPLLEGVARFGGENASLDNTFDRGGGGTGQSRTGFNTSVVFDTVLKEVGNEVIEVNFLPFMRSIKVFFDAQMLKPFSRVFPFFNGTDISDYVKQEAYQEYSDIADLEDNIRTFEGATTHPGTQSVLETDASGRVIGSFIVPRNDVLKFKSGTREFRLTDSSTNDKSAESTFAEAQFHSQGLLEVHQKTIISTKVPRLVTTEVQENRTVGEVSNFDPVEWVDPLAQTVLVDEKGGIFLTSVDIFFKSKDDAIPVNLSIRSVENGIPTQKVVPGSEVLKYPSETLAFELGNGSPGGSTPTTAGDIATAGIAIDDTARYGTRFKFEHPIYLPQDQEYAIVLMAQTNNYNVYISEAGGRDLTDTTKVVSKQPYNGVLFTSQNASTWTPQQTQDLKFTANRASFDTTQKSTIHLVNRQVPSRLLPANPFRVINSGSNTNIRVRVTHPNHGLYHASSRKVKFKDAVAIGSLTAAKLNAVHTAVNVEPNSYEIVIASATAAAGDVGIGGGSAVRAFENMNMDVANIILQNIQLPETTMKFFVKTMNSTTTDQANTDSIQLSGFKQCLVNRNLYFENPQAILNASNESDVNEADSITDDKSFVLKVEMETNLENISPVIDLNRASVIAIQNEVNDAEGNQSNYAASSGDGRSYVAEDSATVKTGGSEVAKYITKEVSLNDEATVIRALLNINKPKDANVNLYYKVLGAGSEDSFDDVAWTEIEPDVAIPENNYGQFTEVEYNKTPGDNFGSMVFKIVLRAKNSARVPLVKDFRVIAAT